MTDSVESSEHPPSRSASPVRLSPYDRMVAESHEVPSRYSILASFFNWIILAGFVVSPATFASLGRVGVLSSSQAGRAVQRVVRHVPILYIAACAFLLGGLGIGWLWWTLKHNYIWLLGRIFMYVTCYPTISLANSHRALVYSIR